MSATLRVLTWNYKRAKEDSSVWNYFLEMNYPAASGRGIKDLNPVRTFRRRAAEYVSRQGINPDIALLQEVIRIPEHIKSSFACHELRTTGKTGNPQIFSTAILTKGQFDGELQLTVPEDWITKELSYFEGHLVAKRIRLNKEFLLNVISVYNPAWYLDQKRLENIDTTKVHLSQNPDVWVVDLLWASLNQIQPGATALWIIGGDFNLSETFDLWRGGPRGNREYLDRMTALGFTEVLRYAKGNLTPTLRNTSNGLIKHQMDHLFLTPPLVQYLINCDTGSVERIFGQGLSNHLPIIADFRF